MQNEKQGLCAVLGDGSKRREQDELGGGGLDGSSKSDPKDINT